MTAESNGTIPGWYGKLPSLGDFASRRLPPQFVTAWDDWLQQVLSATRRALNERWLDRYLTMPIWRFVFLPGLVGSGGWAGVLMPSVDRVGRHFPLVLAAPAPSYTAAAYAVFQAPDWFAGLEEIALGVLDPTRGPDDLDVALTRHLFVPPPTADDDGPAHARGVLPDVEAFGPIAEGAALRAWSERSGWKGFWWTRGRLDDRALMLVSAGLPTTEEFGWLLESRAGS
jgi:type VI secretion system protein ImpM